MYKSDQEFLHELYESHYKTVYRIIYSTLSQSSCSTREAADLTQDVFVIAGEKIDVLRDHEKPVGFLCKAAQLVAKQHIREKFRRGEQLFATLDLHTSREDRLSEAETRMTLERSLSPEDYAILSDYCLKKRPAKDICRERGLSEAALRVRIHRLRKILLKLFILVVTFPIRQYI